MCFGLVRLEFGGFLAQKHFELRALNYRDSKLKRWRL